MKNKKLKETILSDYITIVSANNFYKFCLNSNLFFENETNKILSILDFTNELLNTYKKVMFKLGLIDLSLAILDKEINYSSHNTCEYFTNKTWLLIKIEDFSAFTQYLAKTLKHKIKKLGLNSFELNYLKINKLSEFAL